MSSSTNERPYARFGDENPNLAIWRRNEQTDAFVGNDTKLSPTKPFKRAGGFSGTGINTNYVVKRLTAEFGPVGLGWGVEIKNEEYRDGGPAVKDGTVVGREVIHILRIEFWYKIDGERASFPQFGQTTFISRSGFTDEEAPKKSLTDALLKSASWIGIAADIHMGMWDDQKYVNDREAEAMEERRAESIRKPYAFINDKGDVFHAKNGDEWKEQWVKRIGALQKSQSTGILAEIWRRNTEALDSTRAFDPEAVDQIAELVRAAVEPKPDEASADQRQSGDQPKQAARQTPTTFDLVDHEGTLRSVGVSPKGKSAHENWLTGWEVSLDRLPDPRRIPKFFADNARHLVVMRSHFPQIADAAEQICRERCQQFRIAYPGDEVKPANGSNGK